MLSKSLVLPGNKVYFVVFLVLVGLLKNSYSTGQIQAKGYKHLIVGRWVFKSLNVGNIITVFNKDGSGFSKTDSNKAVYKFRYALKGRILKLSTGTYKPDLHLIKQLTSTELNILPYPYKKYRESIDLMDTHYKRESSH